MAQVVVEKWLGDTLTDNLALFNNGDMRISLFQNDYTPVITSLIGDFTEASFGGYSGPAVIASWTLSGGGWVSPRFLITHPDVVWTADGTTTNIIYGFYVWDDATGDLLWAERRTGGGVVIGLAAGQQYFVAPRFSRRSEYP